MAKKQNLNPAIGRNELMMKRRRGRPKKNPEDADDGVRRIHKTVRYNVEEWEQVEKEIGKKDNDYFSMYARKMTMKHKHFIIDAEATKILRAARKDIVNFINVINSKMMNAKERKILLQSIPTLQQWLPKIEKVAQGVDAFFDYLHRKGFVSLVDNSKTNEN